MSAAACTMAICAIALDDKRQATKNLITAV
jgi:hypothetical protein